MIEITSRETFEAWLKDRPREVAAVLALRGALRGLPNVAREFVPKSKNHELAGRFWVPPLFRVLAAMRYLHFAEQKDLARVAIRNADFDAYGSTDGVLGYHDAAESILTRSKAKSAYLVVESASDLGTGNRGWVDFIADVRFLDAKGTVAALAVQPLWLDGEPAWIARSWASLTRHLLALKNQKWALWIDWYNAQRTGRPPWNLPRDKAEALMGEAVLWDDKEWQEGPEHINPVIEGMVLAAGGVIEAGRETEPAQDPTATLFRAGRGGPVRLAPRQPGDGLTDTPEQREWHAEVRQKVKILQAYGGNELGSAFGSTLDRFARALGRNIAAGRWVSLWSEGNSLRCKLSAHDKAPKNEPDPARLKHDVGESLRDLVETYNQLVLGDEKLSARDAQRPGPQDRATLTAQAKAGDLIVRIAVEREGVADAEVRQALQAGQAAAQSATPDVHGDQALDQTVRQQRNFVSEALRGVRDWAKGEARHAARKIGDSLYSEVGKAAAGAVKESTPPLVQAVITYAESLIGYIQTAFTNVDTIQTLTGIIRWIVGG